MHAESVVCQTVPPSPQSDLVSLARNWFKGSSLAFSLEEAHILAALRGPSVLLLGSLLALHGGNEGERVSPLLGESRAPLEEGPAQSSCSSC